MTRHKSVPYLAGPAIALVECELFPKFNILQYNAQRRLPGLLAVARRQHDELQGRAVSNGILLLKRSVAVAGDNIGAGKFRNILIAPGGGGDIRKLLHAVHHADGDPKARDYLSKRTLLPTY